ncbi:hypothetical protein [Tumebacillus lipolyticus]|uniref:HTH cro/C1-type domain-containing protein n=1 Tax=Tumebacillus lipolyticus TaxID=1280370 RepID=A0ABW4ZTT2_9BACL
MSTLVAPKETTVDKIPLGRRIEEIKKEKGGYYSTAAMSTRIGVHEETLRMMIKGKRDIYSFELEKIAKDLKMPVERITQDDVTRGAAELIELLATKASLERAHELAVGLFEVSIGLTERCNALNNIGRVYFYLERYDSAYEYWMKAYSVAELIHEKFKDNERLHIVLSNLIALFAARKQYSRLSDIMIRIEGVFDGQPEKKASILHAKAMLAEHEGKVEEAGNFLYQTLDCLQVSGHTNKIGRAELNIGYYEYKQKNYARANEILKRSLNHLVLDKRVWLIAMKEYAKTLIKLNRTEEGTQIFDEAISETTSPDLYGKLLLLLSVAKGQPKIAEEVLSLSVDDKIKELACKYLMHYSYSTGDSDGVMKYYGITEGLRVYNSDILHEEDL